MSEDSRPRRSRFDTGEPTPTTERRSRFDRRSRSPSARESESRRTRSPIARGASVASDSPSNAGSQSAKDPLAAAAAARAAAARISAQLQAKKGIQTVDVPPIRSASLSTPPVVRSPSGNKGQAVVGEAYQQDGDYIQDIEINDLRNRYTLTKGAVQKKVNNLCRPTDRLRTVFFLLLQPRRVEHKLEFPSLLRFLL
jgi:hypothetical protein